MYKYTYNELACLFSDFAMVVWLLKTETVFKCLEFESSLQRFYIVTLSDIFCQPEQFWTTGFNLNLFDYDANHCWLLGNFNGQIGKF